MGRYMMCNIRRLVRLLGLDQREKGAGQRKIAKCCHLKVRIKGLWGYAPTVALTKNCWKDSSNLFNPHLTRISQLRKKLQVAHPSSIPLISRVSTLVDHIQLFLSIIHNLLKILYNALDPKISTKKVKRLKKIKMILIVGWLYQKKIPQEPSARISFKLNSFPIASYQE